MRLWPSMIGQVAMGVLVDWREPIGNARPGKHLLKRQQTPARLLQKRWHVEGGSLESIRGSECCWRDGTDCLGVNQAG